MNATYLQPTYYFDYQTKEIQKLIAPYQEKSLSDKDKSIGLYQKVRDNWHYDPTNISFDKATYKASHIVRKDHGNCIEKAVILIAGLRGLGIPARLHLGKVKNHLAIERLEALLGTNELTPHGMVNAYINGKWLKISPAFNQAICTKYNVSPLPFDGENNSYLQAYNSNGTRFMEYIDDYGYFDDVPVDFMVQNFLEHYPQLFDKDGLIKSWISKDKS